MYADLHCNVIAGCGCALQHLIVAAAGAAPQHHARRDKNVLHLFGILLQDLYQQLPRPTETLVVHLHERDHWENKNHGAELAKQQQKLRLTRRLLSDPVLQL